MAFLIAAAGTGGHVYPGLAVGEALIELGVPQNEILYVGGDRLEASVYPERGFEFFGVELAGLQRSLTWRNLRIPTVVFRARNRMSALIAEREVRAVLGMGGYVTIPAALAARQRGVTFFNAEQNAEAGLANRVTARWAQMSFTSFASTHGLPEGRWVGNPVRQPFWDFDRNMLRPVAVEELGVDPSQPTVGVFGGSLGAGVLNEAVAGMAEDWSGPPLQLVHLTGQSHLDDLLSRTSGEGVKWIRLAYSEHMEHFYAACDLVVARSGGAVAELTATATPSILVPGAFGSGSHQEANAAALSEAGAAVILSQENVRDLGILVRELLNDEPRRTRMAEAAAGISKPDAARTIAREMIEAAK